SRKLMAITPIIALGMGFIINSFRVVLMAILTAIQNDTAFDYWHDGKGSLTFGMVAVLSLGGFYMLMMEWDRYQFKQNKAKPGEFSDRSPQFQPLSDDYLIPPDLDVSVQDLELDPDLDLLPPSGETPSLRSPDV
ncbi:MAG: archaeosortase/exosortase family protein, partial [Prochlorothrix sp.]